MKVGEVWEHIDFEWTFLVKIKRMNENTVYIVPYGDIDLYTRMCDKENLVYHLDGWTYPRDGFLKWYRKQYPQPGE